ncbi:MAG: histidinol-phosphatase [Fibrobacter sp.]|nr:histidinol-phosphatase [Fibrobacter sp.]
MSSDFNSVKEICGAIHLHTTYSDGGVGYQELIEAASSVNLDFVAVTDHMSLGGKENGFEGFAKDLCVIVGYEHQDSINHNHYLVFGVQKVFCGIDKPREYVKAVRDAGGIGFLAHPAEKRHYFGNLPPYPWTEWKIRGFDGIEIWNQMSDWMEKLRSPLSAIRLFYPRRFLASPPSELLKKWDLLNRECFISGIGGVDAHTRRIGKGLFSFLIFPIKVELKGIRTHLYIKNGLSKSDYDTSRESILGALRDGTGFFSNYRRGDARGARFYLRNNEGQMILPGKAASFSLPSMLFVEIPQRGSIHLIADGKRVKTVHGSKAEFQISKQGIYRIEVYRKTKAWIYSNPFPVGSYPFQTV